MQAAEKGPSAALRCALRRCGVLFVRLTPQGLRALHLDLFERPAFSQGMKKNWAWMLFTVVAGCLLLAAGGAAAGEWAVAEGTRTWSFPRDHGAHPEYRTEWWYFTGIVGCGRRPAIRLPAHLLPAGRSRRSRPIPATPGRCATCTSRTSRSPTSAGGASGSASACRGPGRGWPARRPTCLRAWVLDWSAAADGESIRADRPRRRRSRSISRSGRDVRRCSTAPAG